MSAPALIACAAATFALALPVTAAASALETQQRAAGAADAAALAAADAAAGWVDAEPCALAAEVASAVGAALAECLLDEHSGDARVTVVAGTAFGRAVARARAGPPTGQAAGPAESGGAEFRAALCIVSSQNRALRSMPNPCMLRRVGTVNPEGDPWGPIRSS